eukprot:scaffold18873_cov64-Cylindrotheca_fusiformis.AAC.1
MGWTDRLVARQQASPLNKLVGDIIEGQCPQSCSSLHGFFCMSSMDLPRISLETLQPSMVNWNNTIHF